MTATIWNGTPYERKAMLDILARNCLCTYDGTMILNMCKLHDAIATDQRFVNGLVFARRNVATWSIDEHIADPDTPNYSPEELSPWIRQYWYPGSPRYLEPSSERSQSSQSSTGPTLDPRAPPPLTPSQEMGWDEYYR